jgi:ABC-type multidrug transport system ATPase subunit
VRHHAKVTLVPSTRPASQGMQIRAEHLERKTTGGQPLLSDVSLTIEPGELVAIVGGSGAGKTTLLEVLAGIRAPDSGSVRYEGLDIAQHRAAIRHSVGYVPQDDIIHAELPLATTLQYAARLRMPTTTGRAAIDATVDAVLDTLDLTRSAGIPVRALSGGQRKRASIAVELLTRPRVFFLDEPTSGLDPATSAALLATLRELADGGATVVLTTHSVQDQQRCDRVLFLAVGGHLAFAGDVNAAEQYFEVDSVDAIYATLATDGSPEEFAARWRERQPNEPEQDDPSGVLTPDGGAQTPGAIRQWTVLTRRTADTLVRNRLTLAILLGSPAMVVAMFAVLFRPGAFAFADPNPSSVIMIVFWIAFGGFFFGLTYGLLQICTEVPIVRRERFVGLSLGAYLASKITILLPFLLFVDLVMLGVLRALDRLPSMTTGTFATLAVTLLLDATAALAIGLFTSAAVSDPSQATLALPLLCFPAVLFSGAILPLAAMAPVGRAISALMPDRWAFEAIGHDLGLRRLFAKGGSRLGPPLLKQYGDAGLRATAYYWAVLGVFIIVFLVASWFALRRRTSVTRTSR